MNMSISRVNLMLSKLMQINSVQEGIIRDQAGIIDELFMLVCQYTTLDSIDGIDPLLASMQDVTNREEELL